jgi:predicted ArsR family transcriptional regulator
MHSTKTDILAVLKRRHGATVDELSSTLGLASMTVRQHLTALERDGVVRAREVRRPNGGRPHFHYDLTEEGHRRVSAGYDRLLQLIVQEAGNLDQASSVPDDRRRELFRRAAASLAAKHRAEVANLSGKALAERLTEMLRSYGGFAEYHVASDGAFEIQDYNCVFRSLVGGDGACGWHGPLLAELLDRPVTAVADECCDGCCRFVIEARRIAPAASGSGQ